MLKLKCLSSPTTAYGKMEYARGVNAFDRLPLRPPRANQRSVHGLGHGRRVEFVLGGGATAAGARRTPSPGQLARPVYTAATVDVPLRHETDGAATAIDV